MNQLEFKFIGNIGTDSARFTITSEYDSVEVFVQSDGGYPIHIVKSDGFTIGFFVGNLNEFLENLGTEVKIIQEKKIVECKRPHRKGY